MRGPVFAQHQPTFGESVVKLLGHAVGGALLFITLAAVAWGVGFGVNTMHSLHPFSSSVLTVLHGVEVGLLYLDMVLSGIVLLVGAFRFVKEISGVSRYEHHL